MNMRKIKKGIKWSLIFWGSIGCVAFCAWLLSLISPMLIPIMAGCVLVAVVFLAGTNMED